LRIRLALLCQAWAGRATVQIYAPRASRPAGRSHINPAKIPIITASALLSHKAASNALALTLTISGAAKPLHQIQHGRLVRVFVLAAFHKAQSVHFSAHPLASKPFLKTTNVPALATGNVRPDIHLNSRTGETTRYKILAPSRARLPPALANIHAFLCARALKSGESSIITAENALISLFIDITSLLL